MDVIDSRHPTSLETKNDSERDIKKKLCLARPSPNKKHQSNCIRQTHHERNIFT